MDVVLYTSRGVPLQGDGAGGLVFGERVGAALVACVAGLTGRPRFLVSKGGITSSDVATQALGMKRAEVRYGSRTGCGGGWRLAVGRVQNAAIVSGVVDVATVQYSMLCCVVLPAVTRSVMIGSPCFHNSSSYAAAAFDRDFVGACSHQMSHLLLCLGRMQFISSPGEPKHALSLL